MTAAARWADFEVKAPALATAGARLLRRDAIPIAFIATVARDGAPTLSPVCPIFADRDVYVSVGAHTAKRSHLGRDTRFALHAMLGTDDEEFQIAGRALQVTDDDERAAVIRAIKFGAYDVTDPIFRLTIERALHVRWENVGRPGTRPIRTRWPLNAT